MDYRKMTFLRNLTLILILAVLISSCRKDQGRDYPHEPSFSNLLFNFERDLKFGNLKYKPFWGKGRIRITNGWDRRNLIKVLIPQIKGISAHKRKKHSGYVSVNKKVKEQFLVLFEVFEKQNLMKYVISWGGSYSARKVKGSSFFLSNHSYGTAFDINAAHNPFGRLPAKPGKKGCVYKLVPIANELGFYWGGHFRNPDGMHFEVAKLLNSKDLDIIRRKYGLGKKENLKIKGLGSKKVF